MPQIELIMPKMGESIMEAEILKWVKQPGDKVEMDETILEIATDKVDSEVPSPIDGVLMEILFDEGTIVEIGKVIAIIGTGDEATAPKATPSVEVKEEVKKEVPVLAETPPAVKEELVVETPVLEPVLAVAGAEERFYSPLVKNIATKEGIAETELAGIQGTGKDGRVTKKDIMAYLDQRGAAPKQQATKQALPQTKTTSNGNGAAAPVKQFKAPPVDKSGNVEIVEMDRMRRLIADHMVMSKHVSPHVTSFVEADVTNLFNWRSRIKGEFQAKYNEKITFTPLFIEAVTKALRDFPMVNVSVDGKQIIVHNDLNIGMATALPSGNLIVPVIKQADLLSLPGLTQKVNDLAARARTNALKPDEIKGGTFTLTNVGTFGNLMGTPIINQPQAAILAAGAIRKKPAVVETDYGDVITIRQMMFLSLSYDHRVVDGALGGSFLRKVADYLEGFAMNRTI